MCFFLLSVDLDTVRHCTGIAVERAKLITKIVQKALEQDKTVKTAAKRDVHNKYEKTALMEVSSPPTSITAPPGMPTMGFGGSSGKLDLLDDEEEELDFNPPARMEHPQATSPKSNANGKDSTAARKRSKSPSPVKTASKPKRALAAPSVAAAVDDDDDLMACVKVKKAKKAKKAKC